MIDLSILLLLNALLIWGFYFSCHFEGYEGFDLISNSDKRLFTKPKNRMILYWVRYRWRLGNHLAKPVYLCTICMSSLHGLIPFFTYYGFSGKTFIYFPFYVLTLAGLNAALMYKVFND